jgi:hypothetical protein
VLRRAFAICAVLVLGSVASSARAHAPPEVQRIVWKNARELVLVSNRGLMFGSLDAQTFSLMCNEALHVNNTEQPGIAYRRDGALLAATSNGLFRSDDQGCSWEPVPPLGALFVSALAQQADDPDTLIVATFGTAKSALQVTHDGGRNWSLLTQLADRDYTQTLLMAPGDPSLLYASGTMLVDTPMPHAVQYVARSKNAGLTWERSELMLEAGELRVSLLAINPVHADELLARASSASPGETPERLLLSLDGGKTFTSSLSLPTIAAATFAADGSAAWVAGSSGIYSAGATREVFERSGGADRLTCIDMQQGELWTCGHYDGADLFRDGIGHTSAPSEGVFERLMNFSDVVEPIDCPDWAPTKSTCRAPWLDFHDEVSRGQTSDAGIADAGSEDAGVVAASSSEASEEASDAAEDAKPMRSSRGSGCALSARGDAGAGNAWGALALSVIAWVLRASDARQRRGERATRNALSMLRREQTR